MISIQLGELDEHEQSIRSAFAERARRKNFEKITTLKIGDRVRFVAGRPRYLIGTIGTVEKVKQSYVLVKLDAPVGKFQRAVNAPISLIELVKPVSPVATQVTQVDAG